MRSMHLCTTKIKIDFLLCSWRSRGQGWGFLVQRFIRYNIDGSYMCIAVVNIKLFINKKIKSHGTTTVTQTVTYMYESVATLLY